MRWNRGWTAITTALVMGVGLFVLAKGLGDDLCIDLTILMGRAAISAVFALTFYLFAG